MLVGNKQTTLYVEKHAAFSWTGLGHFREIHFSGMRLGQRRAFCNTKRKNQPETRNVITWFMFKDMPKTYKRGSRDLRFVLTSLINLKFVTLTSKITILEVRDKNLIHYHCSELDFYPEQIYICIYLCMSISNLVA